MPHDTSSSEEVVVRLLQEETPITIKIHGDYLKLVEKKVPEKEPIPEIKAAEEIITDLEKAISFDDDYDDYDDEFSEKEAVVKKEDSFDEEEEYEDDDEWAKFDGF
jgi:hypothetical protein